ncbi:SdrD B-like domain-containing protein [Calothrix sp. UHCC 0171]|uniref:SdrD B-like domain-containing protein n=1 Tax=Calothrix sp. UHCC 0171 TaxID=3110245 RepID=UPI002B1F8ABD|nr:SdrD B-like domain-containing protein [Calothrix sp. UHCC 0171]MEA5572891.1 SdrD B-like domain-containing protein [Calothrix sp. UHCC 0171]
MNSLFIPIQKILHRNLHYLRRQSFPVNHRIWGKKFKPLQSCFLTSTLAVTHLALFTSISHQKAVAQTQSTCPVGTIPTNVNWQPATGVEAITAQNINAGGVGVRFSFAESIPGQVIESNLVQFGNEVYGTRIDNDVYGGLPGPNLRFHIGIGKNPAPGSATLTITFDRPITLASPLTLLDVDRDGERDFGFTFQDRVTVNAFNGDTAVGVTLNSLGNTTRVTGNVVVGINENSLPSRPDGNVAITPAGAVTRIQILYEPGTEFGQPRQDETIGIAQIRLCAPAFGTIGDTVFNDRNANGVQDEGESGIPNATLILRDANGQEIRRTTTNGDGIYGFPNLPLGTYTVEALRPGDEFNPTTNTTLTANLTQANQELLNIDFGFRSTRLGAADTPNIRLIKRITGATRNGQAIPVNFNTFVPDPNNNNDDTLLQPERFLGVPNLETPLQSGDTVEYTVYFLTEGNENIRNIRLCDLIPNDTTYVNNSIAVNNAGSGADNGRFLSPLAPLQEYSNICNGSNNNGAVVVNLGTIPAGQFGFVRFRVSIN